MLENILIDPISKRPLIVDWDKQKFTDENITRFYRTIESGIPIIIPKEISDRPLAGPQHQRLDRFNYIDHYQKDAEFFDYFLEYESPITNDELHRLYQKITSCIPADAQCILDVGCGNGWLSRARVNSGTQVVSMDISLTNVKKALENKPHPNHLGLVADVFNLPIAENSFDCIVASEIMEHLINPKLFIEQLLLPLKKGGRLLITTPYDEKIIEHLCIHCNRPTPTNAHLHSFNEKNIEQLIPSGIKRWRWDKFANRYLPKVKFYLLIKSWPFKTWEKIDKIANRLIGHETRLLIEIDK